jgi:hypothetical protein
VESRVDRKRLTWYNRYDIGKSFSIAIVGQVVRQVAGNRGNYA